MAYRSLCLVFTFTIKSLVITVTGVRIHDTHVLKQELPAITGLYIKYKYNILFIYCLFKVEISQEMINIKQAEAEKRRSAVE